MQRRNYQVEVAVASSDRVLTIWGSSRPKGEKFVLTLRGPPEKVTGPRILALRILVRSTLHITLCARKYTRDIE